MKQTIHHWLSGSKPAALPGILALLSLHLAPSAFAQGALTPPGAPQPTMKSLQEIWNELQSVKSTVTSQAAEIAALKSLQQRSSATVLHYATGGSLPWSLTTVDSAGDVGMSTSLAFGPDGQPAISYYDNSNLHLKFARFNGNSWSVTTVDSVDYVGYATSLAFGPDGQPAISYYDDSNSDLKFARYNGNSWSLTTVDSAGDVGMQTSLAFGPDGQPAISYYDESNGDLKIARMGIFTPRP